MKIFKLNPENPDMELINKVIDVLADGGIVLYPTDTIYGLGANIFSEEAVSKIYAIKNRARDKPLSVLVSDFEGLNLVSRVSQKQRKYIETYLPGPFTFLLFKKPIVSSILTPNTYKVGVRIPDYKISRLLAQNFPITTTSANVSNKETLSNPKDIVKQLGNNVDLVIDVGELNNHTPSTIIDLTKNVPILIRK